MTAIFAAIFMVNSLCLTYLFQRDARAAPVSLLDQVPVTPSAPAAQPTAPAPAPNADAVPVAPAQAPAEQQQPEKP